MLLKIGELAKKSGVSIRTLRYYEEIELLLPAQILESGYRLYGESEALRLQQIFFYKELDYDLQSIKSILDDDDFNLLNSLEIQKSELLKKKKNLNQILKTLDNTINKLKGEKIMNVEELYEGFPSAKEYREEAIEKYGDDVFKSEEALMKLKKEDFNKLNSDFHNLWLKLAELSNTNIDPNSDEVQELILQHFKYMAVYWGVKTIEIKKEQYLGLADLYIEDKRFTTINDVIYPNMGKFLKESMNSFANEYF